MNNRSVSIFNCGGAGINVGRLITDKLKDDVLTRLDIQAPEIYYVDTSASNLNRAADVPRDRVFLYDGLDGSGKERGENHALIAKTTLKILQQFAPGNFNIVISSAAGGSGAVIAHSLIAELKKAGHSAILILIGSTASRKEIENTVKTLKSLDGLARSVDSPVAVHYLENSAEASRQVIDKLAVNATIMLIGLFAGSHHELDSADLKRWLTHDDLANEAYSLTIVHNRDDYARAKDVISVATLAGPDTNTILEPVPAYQAVGYVNDAWVGERNALLEKGEPLSFLLSSEIVEIASKALLAKLATVEKVHSSRVRRDSLDTGGAATDDGLHL